MMLNSSEKFPTPDATEHFVEQINEQLSQGIFDTENSQLLEGMVEALADQRGLVRLSLVEAFGKIGQPAIPFLVEALTHHSNPVVRRSSAKALAKIRQPDTISHLIGAMVKDEDTVVRSSAAGALAGIGSAALPALLEVIAGEYPEPVKGQATWAIARAGVEAVEPLHLALKSDKTDIRLAALEGIAKIAEEHGDELSQNAILSVLQDDDLEVRLEAIASLSRFPSQVALPKLIPLLEDDNLEVVQRAILALGKLGEPEVLPILQAKLAEKREGIAQFVKIAISQLKCR